MVKLPKSKSLSLTSYFAQDYENINLQDFWINIKETNEGREIYASPKQVNESGVTSYPAHISIFGNYNIYNALAAFSCIYSFKPQQDKAKDLINALGNLQNIEGRMNFLWQDPTVIVDFAHTPNAMEKALSSAQSLRDSKYPDGKIWVIFGCAGLRDHYKRPAMGAIAHKYGDVVLITSEDPRTESLAKINEAIIAGFNDAKEEYKLETYSKDTVYTPQQYKQIFRFDEPSLQSRQDAINFALTNAAKSDIVIMLGKGHETSMCFGETEYAWNDIKAVQQILHTS
jgi:UDP-N-acetylmuramoyl-L-alanyl-D-glutamate--2,6-diaminopimelate ligase